MARYTPAIYTHCYDGSGTRLFAAGGPLAVERRGNYASIWSWFRNKCQKPCRRDLFYKKNHLTQHTRASRFITTFHSVLLILFLYLFFFFHPILLKNLGGNFSTITENVVILTLTYELSNCWFGENKAANKVVVRCFGHLFNAASENHRFSLSPSSPQFSTAQSLLRWWGLFVRNFFKT